MLLARERGKRGDRCLEVGNMALFLNFIKMKYTYSYFKYTWVYLSIHFCILTHELY